jgi:aspartyl-tRNA(Asn)/glutamyl-tRNA(Gln) amidotransferase subunit B
MVEKGQVSAKNAKQTVEEVIKTDKDPGTIIKERGWEQITDKAEIGRFAQNVYNNEKASFEEIKTMKAAGNVRRVKAISAYLVGKVIAASGGRADPKLAGEAVAQLME